MPRRPLRRRRKVVQSCCCFFFLLLHSCLFLIASFVFHFIHHSLFVPPFEVSRRRGQFVSDFLQVFWYGVATFAGGFFGWSRTDGYPVVATALYVHILPFSFTFIKFLGVELGELELGKLVQQWFRIESVGGASSASWRGDGGIGGTHPPVGFGTFSDPQAPDERKGV